jgi:1-Cys peroxiredoxin 6
MIVAPFVTTEDARARFNNLKIEALPSGKEYLRYVDNVTWESETLPSGQPSLRYVDALPTPVSMVPSEPPPDLPSAPVAAGDYTIKLGAVFPNFECRTTKGNFKFHEFLQKGEQWTILFSHPKDFTPVCTTEIGKLHKQVGEYSRRGVKLIGLSCDSVEDHKVWSKDVLHVANEAGEELAFPIIADEKRVLASMLGMLDPLERDAAAMPLPARALFLIGPDKTNRLTLLYPATTGRDFSEVLRVVDSLKYTADPSLVTPANWKEGDRMMVAATVSEETLQADPHKFANLEVKPLPSGKEYMRFVDCPRNCAIRPPRPPVK